MNTQGSRQEQEEIRRRVPSNPVLEAAGRVNMDWVERFEEGRSDGIWYRLYRGVGDGPRPLILYLHGGGESGTDNRAQLEKQFGAAALAEQYPYASVLAPQTPVDERRQRDEQNGPPAYAKSRMYGWTREYLAVVCGVIRRMIAAGEADPDRITVTGAARGGGGAVLAMDVGADLFAAAAPVCPRIPPEVFEALRGMADRKIWISVPYVDESLTRNKYIVDAVLELKDRGGRDIHLTIYGPEELAAYGIGSDPSLTLEQRLRQNHGTWILTYHNEHGILDWLVAQRRDMRQS